MGSTGLLDIPMSLFDQVAAASLTLPLVTAQRPGFLRGVRRNRD